MKISKPFLIFIFYSILGFIWETIFCTIISKQWQSRGMLFGPWCPIYGVGGVLITFFVSKMQFAEHEPLKIFLICMIGSAVLEYTTSYVCESLFHAVWWDYSDWPLNINGRVCLYASVGFGFAGLIGKYFVCDIVLNIVNKIPENYVEPLFLFALILFIADVTLTADSLAMINQKLSETSNAINEIMGRRYSEVLTAAGTAKNTTLAFFSNMRQTTAEFTKISSEETKKLLSQLSPRQLNVIKRMSKIRDSHDSDQFRVLLSLKDMFKK